MDAPDDLDEHHRVAVAMADALMTRPTDLPTDVVDALRRHFTAEQLVELSLDVMKWNYQKVMVALGTHAEVRPGELTDLVFDERGHWVRPD